MSSAMVRRAAQPPALAALTQIRRLRDEHLLRGPQGKPFSQLVEGFGPMLTEAIRTQPDAAKLRERISQFLLAHFHEHADLERLSREIAEPSRRAVALLHTVAKNRQAGDLERIRARAVRFIREEISEGVSFPAVMAALAAMLKEEEEHIAKRSDQH